MTTDLQAGSSQHRFDVAVVGGGLMGSAASRYLAEAGHRVVVVAAPEPTNWATSDGPFASHYDSGRITRVMAGDPVWAELAARAISRYSDIEARSGIQFHTPCALAWLGVDIEGAVANAVERGANARMVTSDWLLSTAGIRLPTIERMACAWEEGPAGVVNPRELAAAQLRLAQHAGAEIIAHPASSLSTVGSHVEVRGDFGSVEADRVLVAAGAYGGELAGVDLGLDRQLRTTVRIDMGPVPALPSIIADQVEHPYVGDAYSNPPVRYPDGRLLFKIGCEIVDPPRAQTAAEITAWFRGNGDAKEADALLATTQALLPGAEIRSWEAVPCVITRTPSGYPKIGWLDDRVAVAFGGNGSSAKCSDELGRLASTLFSPDGWVDAALPAELFSP